MENELKHYYDALERLRDGRPQRVAIGTRISNDAVSLEAGLSKGCIKKSRPVFAELIEAIKAAAKAQKAPSEQSTDAIKKAKETAKNYQTLYHESLERELALIHEVYSLREQINTLKSRQQDKVRHLHKGGPNSDE